MSISKRDREFRLPKISYLEFKQIEMDRVLTRLFERLEHNGYPSRVRRKFELTVEHFAQEFIEHPEWFSGFDKHPDILTRWIETHLMDVVHRGKARQAIAAPRPLHGFTYRFRNPKHSRDYGAAQHLYELLYAAEGGQDALQQLEAFFFQGHDKVTGKVDNSVTLDVETQALLRLMHQVEDAADTRSGANRFPPLCPGSAALLAEDIKRLLFYQSFIPRSVMVDYLKILLGFHLALYHLRLFKLLPDLVRRHGGDPSCTSCPMAPHRVSGPQGDCPHQFGLLLDVASLPGSAMALLAERSADAHYRRIPGFIQAYFATKKLDEFGTDLVRRGKRQKPASGHLSVAEVLQLLEPIHKIEREKFFGQRVYGLIQNSSGSLETDLDPELQAVVDMKLGEFDTYIEMLVALRGRFHRQYITESMDSLLLKNRPGALIAQPGTRTARRRFVLDSRLLEVILQIAVLTPGGKLGYHTGTMRIDELLTFLRERYGLYVDQLPPNDGFTGASIADRRALRENVTAFTGRLREVGFYQELSDAYVTQTVTPRFRIGRNGPEAGKDVDGHGGDEA